jgi:hypothetical protein
VKVGRGASRYSSGIYAKYVSFADTLQPAQARSGFWGARFTKAWNLRYELAYKKCKGENVTWSVGVPDRAALGPISERAPPVPWMWKVQGYARKCGGHQHAPPTH